MEALPITRLFEIHITVDTSGGLFGLYEFVQRTPGLKIVLATSRTGRCKDQYMISKWKNGTFLEVRDRALALATAMKEFGLLVTRVKVESMAHNTGVPANEAEWQQFAQEHTLVGGTLLRVPCQDGVAINSDYIG